MDGQQKIKYFLVVGFLLWIVSLSGVLGNSGFIQAVKLRHASSELAAKVEDLKTEKNRLARVLSSLEKDTAAQEVVIRDTLGFVRPGEIVFEWGR